MSKITWTNEKRKLSQLIPWPRNPRQITKAQGERLNESLEEFGQFDVIAIGPGDVVYNGHQRLAVWGEKYGPDFEVAVRVASRELTEKERERLTILAHKGAAGEWDMEILANEFDLGELVDWGFRPFELGIMGEGNDPNAEWKGMPEFEQEDLTGVRQIIVHFKTHDDVDAFAELIGQKITERQKFIWYPKAEIMRQSLVIENDRS